VVVEVLVMLTAVPENLCWLTARDDARVAADCSPESH
jgi:hypothetical protein